MSSIEKRTTGDTPVWRVRFRHEGKNRAVSFVSEPKAIAWRKRLDAQGPAKALAAFNQPAPVSTLTVAEHLERHITSLTGVEDGTRHTYRRYIVNHMQDIGPLPLDALDHETVAAWVNRLAAQGSAGKTIKNLHGFLSHAMAGAVGKHIPENPCHGMRLPKTDHVDKEMVFLTRDEFAELYALIPARFQPFFLTLVGTGMRFSEATSLTVADVDLAASTARVRKAWKMTGSAKRKLGPPKSDRSKRTVVLPRPVVEAIRPLVEGRGQGDLVFTNAHGGPIKEATIWRNTWAPAVRTFAGDTVRFDRDKAGRKVPKVVKVGPGKHPRIHDLRHTFASWAISSGINLPALQRSLGHQSVVTTVDRYGHLARADFDALAAATAINLPQVAIEGAP